MDQQQHNKVWKILNNYSIYTEQDFQEALKKKKPINIGIMVSKPNKKKKDKQ